MKLSPQQLPIHLKNSLLPIYLISGSEPLLAQEARDAILKAAKQNGFSDIKRLEANKDFDWNKLVESTNTLSLFSDKSVIDLKLNYKPLAAASKIFTQAIEKNNPNNLMIVSCDKLDSATQKSSWFCAISNSGGVVTIWPPDPTQFKQWVEQRLRQYQLSCDIPAIQYLVERTEGNLLAVAQEIEKLKLLFDKQPINLENMVNAIADNARYDIFYFIDIIFEGNATRIKRVLYKLKEEAVEPTLLLWAITREVRLLLNIISDFKNKMQWDLIAKKNKIWAKRQPLIKKMLKIHSSISLHRLLIFSEKIDHTIKGLRQGNVWDELEIIALTLSGLTLFNQNLFI